VISLYCFDTSTLQEFHAVFDGHNFVADIPVGGSRYALSARVNHVNFFRESEVFTLAVTPLPVPPLPPSIIIPTPEPEPVAPEAETFPWLYAVVGGAALACVLLAVIVWRARKKQGRVFTGRLVIEVTDHYTREKLSPEYRNLIEYGKKTDLLTLLRGQGSPALSGVVLMPSPTASSHMPQVIIKCTNKQLKFKKDFMEQDATKGLSMGLRSELTIQLEAENKSVKLRYTE
jgi:hypothetical protein